MFFGEFTHQMDAKNRIRIPTKFKAELGTSYVVGKSVIPGVIAVYPLAVFEEISKAKHSPFDMKAEMAYSKFFGTFFTAEEDGQGRLLINEQLRRLVPLGKNLVSVGAQDHINLMSQETYDKMQQEMSYDDAFEILNRDYAKQQQ